MYAQSRFGVIDADVRYVVGLSPHLLVQLAAVNFTISHRKARAVATKWRTLYSYVLVATKAHTRV